MLKAMLIISLFLIFIIGGVLFEPSDDYVDIDYWMGGY